MKMILAQMAGLKMIVKRKNIQMNYFTLHFIYALYTIKNKKTITSFKTPWENLVKTSWEKTKKLKIPHELFYIIK